VTLDARPFRRYYDHYLDGDRIHAIAKRGWICQPNNNSNREYWKTFKSIRFGYADDESRRQIATDWKNYAHQRWNCVKVASGA